MRKDDNMVICDICGFAMKASKTRFNYKGQLVCFADYEPRHPLELLRPRKERPRPRKIRVEGEFQFLERPVTKDDL